MLVLTHLKTLLCNAQLLIDSGADLSKLTSQVLLNCNFILVFLFGLNSVNTRRLLKKIKYKLCVHFSTLSSCVTWLLTLRG